MGVETLLLVAVVVVLAWLYSRWRHNYWASMGVASPPTVPIIGHLHTFVAGKRWLYVDKVYHRLRSNKFWGLYEFFNPVLMVTDPELLKHIMVKDFEHFVDRRLFGDQKGSVMSEMLSNKLGEEWKDLRTVMTPTFSSGKMRGMFHLICEKAEKLVSFSFKKAANSRPVNMKDMFGRFTMDTIASCAFGIECNSLSDSRPVFTEKAEVFFNTSVLRSLKLALMVCLPKLYTFLGFKVDLPEIEFFAKLSKENMATREKGQKRGDFLDLLMEARASEDALHPSKRVFGESTLVAQSVMFLVAGYDTTATTLAFTAFHLAKHAQHQQRLRHELQEIVQEYSSVSYQGIMEAKFLDACLMETLRLYPPGTIGERKCTKQYRVPGTDVTLRPGDVVQIPIWSLHRDPHYWSAADEFRPERFLPENRDNIHSFTHMPFGMGPRNCIAMRFALMEAKVALAHLVLAADLQLAPGHEDLKLENSPFFVRPKGGVMLLLTPLKKE